MAQGLGNEILAMAHSYSYYHFENEAIGAVVLYFSIKELNTVSIAKALVVLPILLHEPLAAKLSSATKYRSIDELLIKERVKCGNINSRFQSLLPISINSISILIDAELIQLDGIFLSTTNKRLPLNTDIGLRAAKILKAVPKVSLLLAGDDVQIYRKFNIDL